MLVSPVPIKEAEDAMFDEESAGKTRELASIYRAIAEQWGCLFFDAGSVVKEPGADGIHMTENGHRMLGEALAEFVREQEK